MVGGGLFNKAIYHACVCDVLDFHGGISREKRLESDKYIRSGYGLEYMI